MGIAVSELVSAGISPSSCLDVDAMNRPIPTIRYLHLGPIDYSAIASQIKTLLESLEVEVITRSADDYRRTPNHRKIVFITWQSFEDHQLAAPL